MDNVNQNNSSFFIFNSVSIIRYAFYLREFADIYRDRIVVFDLVIDIDEFTPKSNFRRLIGRTRVHNGCERFVGRGQQDEKLGVGMFKLLLRNPI